MPKVLCMHVWVYIWESDTMAKSRFKWIGRGGGGDATLCNTRRSANWTSVTREKLLIFDLFIFFKQKDFGEWYYRWAERRWCGNWYVLNSSLMKQSRLNCSLIGLIRMSFHQVCYLLCQWRDEFRWVSNVPWSVNSVTGELKRILVECLNTKQT